MFTWFEVRSDSRGYLVRVCKMALGLSLMFALLLSVGIQSNQRHLRPGFSHGESGYNLSEPDSKSRLGVCRALAGVLSVGGAVANVAEVPRRGTGGVSEMAGFRSVV